MKRRDPLNDDHYDGNDDQIEDLKNLVRRVQAKTRKRLYLMVVWGDVQPELRGPFKSEQHRLEYARKIRRINGDSDGIYPINVSGTAAIGTYSNAEMRS